MKLTPSLLPLARDSVRGFLQAFSAELVSYESSPLSSPSEVLWNEMGELGWCAEGTAPGGQESSEPDLDATLLAVLAGTLATSSPALASLLLSQHFAARLVTRDSSPLREDGSPAPAAAQQSFAVPLYSNLLADEPELSLSSLDQADASVQGTVSYLVGPPCFSRVVAGARRPDGERCLVELQLAPGVSFQRCSLLGLWGASCWNQQLAPGQVTVRQVISGVDLEGRVQAAQKLIAPALAAIAEGLAQTAVARSLSYAELRIQGGQPIVLHPAVATLLETERRAIRTAQAARSSLAQAGASLGALTDALEGACEATSAAIQVLGGAGYMRGADVERLYRDAQQLRLVLGRPGLRS